MGPDCIILSIIIYLSAERCSDLPDIANGSNIIYTPPHRVLSRGHRYIGTIATYSCLPGYKLVGESSVRACVLDGSWNGAEPLCGENL